MAYRFTNWGGEYSSQQSRKLFSEAGILTYRTPEGAVTAFMHMVNIVETEAAKRNTSIAFRCQNEYATSAPLH